MPGEHIERPIRLAGGETYCSCGRPWPCPIAELADLEAELEPGELEQFVALLVVGLVLADLLSHPEGTRRVTGPPP
jgi:hypothetical protein